MAEPVADRERVLRTVNQFYEENPFPGFDLAKYKTKDDLDRQASWWAHKLDAEIPFDSDVIGIGSGTGQLANFLRLKGPRVTASTTRSIPWRLPSLCGTSFALLMSGSSARISSN